LTGKRVHVRPWWPLILVLMLVASCDLQSDEEPLARVHDKFLYPSDLQGLVPPNGTAADSIEFVEGFVERWTREAIVLHQAEQNLLGFQKEIERQLENDRRELIVYAYEKALIDQKLDTVITIEEIEEYYHKNREIFLLKDYIVRVLYVKMDTSSPVLKDIDKLYKLRKDDDLLELTEICAEQALNFYYDSTSWLYFDDLAKEIPLTVYSKEEFLERNKPIKFEDDGVVYYLNVLEYKLKDNISPLPLQHEKIRNIIINQRKPILIEKMRTDLYNDGLDHHHIEIFQQ
jgi:hypothetical protein